MGTGVISTDTSELPLADSEGEEKALPHKGPTSNFSMTSFWDEAYQPRNETQLRPINSISGALLKK